MRFIVTINTENAAFEPDAAAELARILRHIADTLPTVPKFKDGAWHCQTIRDVNGNDVGRHSHK